MTARAAAAERPAALRTWLSTYEGKLTVLCGVCIGIPLLVAFLTGTIHHPHDDDWAFFRILWSYADHGRLQLVGWNEMMLVGQIGLVVPLAKLLGHDVTAINTFAALVSGAGLFATGLVARRFVPPTHSLLVVALVAIFPAWIFLVPTFMTDNLGFAAEMTCVAIGLTALDRDGRNRAWLLAVALLIGVFGFSVREFGVVAPLAVVGGYFVAERGRPTRAMLGPAIALVAVVASCALTYHLRHTLVGDSAHSFGSPAPVTLLIFGSQALFTFALGVVPALVIALRRRVDLAPTVAVTTIVAIALGFFAVSRTAGNPTCCFNGQGSVFLGNLMTERGPLGNQALFGDRPILFPESLWLLLTGAAIASAGVLLALGLRRLKAFRLDPASQNPSLATLLCLGLGTVAAVAFRSSLGGPIFDRYLTIPVAVAAIVLLRGQEEVSSLRETKGAFASFVVLALVALVTITSGYEFDAARWRGGEELVAAGIPATDIDAGFEWVGYHYPGIAHEAATRRSVPTPPGYMDMFLRAGNCGLVTATEQTGPDYVLIDAIPYRDFLGLRAQHVWAYRFLPGCAASSAVPPT